MFSKTITKSQIAAIHTLLHKHNLMEEKRQVIEQISNGRTSRTTELTWTEAQQWINAMNQGHEYMPPKTQHPNKDKMIKSIIAMAHEMGWIKRETIAQPDGSLKPQNNYSDLHDWVLKFGYLKKPLNEYSYEELPILVTAFRNVYSGWLKRYH